MNKATYERKHLLGVCLEFQRVHPRSLWKHGSSRQAGRQAYSMGAVTESLHMIHKSVAETARPGGPGIGI